MGTEPNIDTNRTDLWSEGTSFLKSGRPNFDLLQ